MSRYHGECSYCGKTAFLRPVATFPGFAGPDCLVVVDLCLGCRLRPEDPRYCTRVEEFLHSPRAAARECARWALEWHARTQEVQPGVTLYEVSA